MLEADAVDEDFFTPVASTSLANIFGTSSKEAVPENTSLKYTPQSPRPQIVPKQEELKRTECMFACALRGFEWFNNVYNSKGRLGFAILKIIKNDSYNMVLYDSNKVTLSCTTISSSLEVSIKQNNVSYYDNAKKYWSLTCSTEDDCKKIIEHLHKLNVDIKYTQYNITVDNDPLGHDKVDNGNDDHNQHNNSDVCLKGSDTDSSVNTRTKLSILNRMASMGQSVLPQLVTVKRSSDSSDEMNVSHHSKPRHKGHSRRNLLPAEQNSIDMPSRTLASKNTVTLDATTSYSQLNKEIIPAGNNISNVIGGGNDMSFFMSEQRINNSETRITMSRITDKVDQILDKVKYLDPVAHQNHIYNKLLNEYENKIKMYDEFIKINKLDINICNNKIIPSTLECNTYNNDLTSKVDDLKSRNNEQNNEITKLKTYINQLEKESAEMCERLEKIERTLSLEIVDLKNELSKKSKNSIIDDTLQSSQDSVKDKIKMIMNDTFHTISANFEVNENYSGDSVKNIIAKVIKKVTLESIGE